MSKSIEEMYEGLMTQSNLFSEENISDILNPGVRYEGNDDDGEYFITSKEIVKTKETLEKRYGLTSDDDGVIEESVHFKRYGKRREHKYTESEIAKIKESCIGTIVHDYGEHDVYHISDEERKKNDILSEIDIKLKSMKRTYRRVDQYIEAMRIVVEAWSILEKSNFIHTKEEFYKFVAEGRIVSNRIIMPKLKKMDSFNVDMIIKYISNPSMNAQDLVPEKPVEYDSFYDDFIDDERETTEELAHRLLSQEELQFIVDHVDNPPEIKVHDIPRSLIKGYDKRLFGEKKKKGKDGKRISYLKEDLHDLLNKIQMSPTYRNSDMGRSYMIANSLFEPEKLEKDFWEDLYFDGSWANESDNMIYDMAVREELLKQHPYKERYLTYGDKELGRFFRILEENGVNTIDLRRKMDVSSNSTDRTKIKNETKENRRIESAMIQRITKLNDSPKFQRIATKAEKAINKQYND